MPLRINERAFALLNTPGGLPRPNGLSVTTINSIPSLAALKTNHTETSTRFGETRVLEVFAHATWAVTDRLELTVGKRFTGEDKTSGYSATFDNGSVLGSGASPADRGLIIQPTAPGGQFSSIEDNDVTYRAVGRFELTDSVSVFTSHASGRRPKVLGAAAPTCRAPRPVH